MTSGVPYPLELVVQYGAYGPEGSEAAAQPTGAGAGGAPNPPGRFSKFLEAAKATWILYAGIRDNSALLALTGFGNPDKGDRFGAGSLQFFKVDGVLASAQPDARWSGAGADAYESQNTSQRNLATTMAEADQKMHETVKQLAGKVTHVRITLEAFEGFLAVCVPVAIGLYLTPVAGPSLAVKFQIGAVAVTTAGGLAAMIALAAYSGQYAADVHDATNTYDRVASAAHLTGESPSFLAGTAATAGTAGTTATAAPGASGGAGVLGRREGGTAFAGGGARVGTVPARPATPPPPIVTPRVPGEDADARVSWGWGAMSQPRQPLAQRGPARDGANPVGPPAPSPGPVATRKKDVTDVDDHGTGTTPDNDAAHRAPADFAQGGTQRGPVGDLPEESVRAQRLQGAEQKHGAHGAQIGTRPR